ncbi:hypothetical protein UA08_04733 [Talaromyces atroroseus]|uniref:Uncharacterized protein n=1 Tax=Talaromyces atroroseus TaxID=1441469 RepID=A0A225AYK6_TALAT|nr:hypothetical protein UA08_04733 [Talaromyces atroroseus]OKL60056.1 hypothetical protein UA08_04733 [Talaromyces atroroseus]
MEKSPKDMDSEVVDDKELGVTVKMTGDGIPLVPQPSDDPTDALNWSSLTKHTALVVLAFESFLIKFSAVVVAPSALLFAEQFDVSKSTATYLGSAPTILNAITSFIWIPLSHRMGRRPILLLGNLVALIAAIGVANSQTFAQALGCRMVQTFFGSVGLSIGPAAISDMFFLHEKGKRMGVNSILLVIGPYVGGVVGGAIAGSSLGWRWSVYLTAILFGAEFIAQFLFVPETIYERDQPTPYIKLHGPLSVMRFRIPTITESWRETFLHPFVMFAYLSVLLPAFWFSVAAMTEVGNTAGFVLNFGADSQYHFTTTQVGLCYLSGIIGAGLGEICGGPLCDLMARSSIKQNKEWRPERLLHLSWLGLLTTVAGILLYGFELEYGHSWVSALTGIALLTFGQEVLVTVLLTYMTDCYRAQASEVAIVFQFFFAVQCYHVPFYLPQWIAEPAGVKVPYLVFAVLPIVLFPPCIGSLMWKGRKIRSKGALPRKRSSLATT